MLEILREQLLQTTWPEWLGIVTGVTGVFLGIKEKLAAWPLFILCYAAYVYISYQCSLWAFMGMNIVFIVLSVYGWSKWARGAGQDESEVAISHVPRQHLIVAIGLLGLGTVGLGSLLVWRGEANAPYLDSFATCCGFIAQWLHSRKHIETWLFWIASDLVYIRLLGEQGSLTSVVLFGIFILLAIKGWGEWRQRVVSATKPMDAVLS